MPRTLLIEMKWRPQINSDIIANGGRALYPHPHYPSLPLNNNFNYYLGFNRATTLANGNNAEKLFAVHAPG